MILSRTLVYIFTSLMALVPSITMAQVCEFKEIEDYYIKTISRPVCEPHRLELFRRCILDGGKDRFTSNCFNHLVAEDFPKASGLGQDVRVALYNICVKQSASKGGGGIFSMWTDDPTDIQVPCCDHLRQGEACLVNSKRCGCNLSSLPSPQYTPPSQAVSVSVAMDFHCSTSTGFNGRVNQTAWSTISCSHAEEVLSGLDAQSVCGQLGQNYKFIRREKIRTDTCS
jgi:hypothetical protein